MANPSRPPKVGDRIVITHGGPDEDICMVKVTSLDEINVSFSRCIHGAVYRRNDWYGDDCGGWIYYEPNPTPEITDPEPEITDEDIIAAANQDGGNRDCVQRDVFQVWGGTCEAVTVDEQYVRAFMKRRREPEIVVSDAVKDAVRNAWSYHELEDDSGAVIEVVARAAIKQYLKEQKA